MSRLENLPSEHRRVSDSIIRPPVCLLLLGLVIGFLPLSATATSCGPRPANNVGYWAFEGTLLDAFAFDQGSVTGAVGYGPAKVGKGLVLAGWGTLVMLPASQARNVGAGDGFTVDFWVSQEDPTRSQPLIEWNDGGKQTGVQIWAGTAGAGTVAATLSDVAGNHGTVQSPPNTIADSLFHHIALTYDRALGLALLYVDGVEVARRSVGSMGVATAGPILVGSDPTTPQASDLHGTLDQLAIYSRPLTPSEIGQIVAAGTDGVCSPADEVSVIGVDPASGSVEVGSAFTLRTVTPGAGAWTYQWLLGGSPIPGATGTTYSVAAATALDGGFYSVRAVSGTHSVESLPMLVLVGADTGGCLSSPDGIAAFWPFNGSAAELIGGTVAQASPGVTFVDAKVRTGASFDGTGGSMLVPAGTVADLRDGSGITLEMWFKAPDGQRAQPLLDWTTETGTLGTHLWLGVGGQGAVFANLVDTGGGGHVIGTAAGAWSAGIFHHLALTYDSASGVAVIYLDGISASTVTFAPFTPQTSYQLNIGRRPGYGTLFQGVLDEVTLYKRSLSAGEIGGIYAAGAVGKCGVAAGKGRVFFNPVRLVGYETQPMTLLPQGLIPAGAALQWYKGEQPIPGATSLRLQFSSVTPGDTGDYSVRVLSAAGPPFLATMTLVVNAAPDTCLSPPPGLVAAWRLQGDLYAQGMGSIAGARGTLVFTNGYVGRGLFFDGGPSAGLDVQPVPELDLGKGPDGFSVEAWVQPIPNGQLLPILGWEGSGLSGVAFYLSGVGSSALGATLQSADGVTLQVTSDVGLVPAGVFSHVALTYSKSDATARLYLNGKVVAMASQGGMSPMTAFPVLIGRNLTGGSFNGVIDELAIYGREIGFAEIKGIIASRSQGKCTVPLVPPQISRAPVGGEIMTTLDFRFSAEAIGGWPLVYQWIKDGVEIPGATQTQLSLTNVPLSGAGRYQIRVSNGAGVILSPPAYLAVDPKPTECLPLPPTLVENWRMEGMAAGDYAGTPPLYGGGLAFGSGRIGTALVCDGNSTWLRTPASPRLDLGQGDGFTVEGWIRTTAADKPQSIVEWDQGVMLWVSPTGDRSLFASLIDTSGGAHDLRSAPGIVPEGVFVHVALTYDRISGIGTLYLRGMPVATEKLGSFLAATHGDFRIASRYDGGFGTTHFQGALDEISLYSVALMPSAVARLAVADQFGKCAAPLQAPILDAVPEAQTVDLGVSAYFSVHAHGSPLLFYQWLRDGVPIEGAIKDTLAVYNCLPADEGEYSVRVSNPAGSLESPAVRLSVLDPRTSTSCLTPPPGIVARLGFEGDLVDGASSRLPAAETPVTYAQGMVGAALHLDGVATSLWVDTPAVKALGRGPGFSIECWVRPLSWSVPQPVVEWWDPTIGVGPHLWLFPNGELYVNLIDTSGGAHSMSAHIPTLGTGFQHIAMTYDAVTGVGKLYGSGELLLTTALGSLTPRTSGQMYIGRRVLSAGNPSVFNGELDELNVYSGAIDAQQVHAIFAAGTHGYCNLWALPIEIVTQPLSQQVVDGAPVTFSVETRVGLPSGYQWRKDGYTIPGATNATYRIPRVSALDAGVYTVSVFGSRKTVESRGATLEVLPSGAPRPRFTLSGGFSTLSNPAGPWSYGWKSNVSGVFLLDPYPFGSGTEDEGWAGVPGWYPAIHHNATTNTAYADGHQAVLPGDAVWMFPGVGSPYDYAAVRFQVPDGGEGSYDLKLLAEPYLPLPVGGDNEIIGLHNGEVLFDRAMGAGEVGSYFGSVLLSAGDFLEILVGRGADNDLRGSGVKLKLELTGLLSSPVALPQELTLAEDSSLRLVLGTLPAASSHFVYHISEPAHGYLLGTPPSLLYVPAGNYNGPDAFTFSVSNGESESLPATVTIQVTPVDDPPVADAQATPLRVVYAVNGSNAPVVLDGGRSYDPDGRPLSFTWFNTRSLGVLSTNKVDTVVLPTGTHDLGLMVGDAALLDLDFIRVEVRPLAAGLEAVRRAAVAAGLPSPTLAAMELKLQGVELAALAGDSSQAALGLRGYLELIPASGLTAATAAALRSEATDLERWASGGGARPRLEVQSCDGHGCLRLTLLGNEGQTAVMEESLDFRVWSPVGQVILGVGGSAEVERSLPGGGTPRFYRARFYPY